MVSSSNTDSHKTSVAGVSPCGKISFILRYLSERSVVFVFDYECIHIVFLVRNQFKSNLVLDTLNFKKELRKFGKMER